MNPTLLIRSSLRLSEPLRKSAVAVHRSKPASLAYRPVHRALPLTLRSVTQYRVYSGAAPRETASTTPHTEPLSSESKSAAPDTSDEDSEGLFGKYTPFITKADYKDEYGFLRTYTGTESTKILKIRKQVAMSRMIELTRTESWTSWILSKLLYKPDVRYHLLADLLYRYTKEHCERVEWKELGIPTTFASWFQVTLIHMWVLLVRTRSVPDKKLRKAMSQRLIDNFFVDVERGIVLTGNVTNPIIVGKSNKTFLKTYYGSMAALDEAFIKGDAALADALYRNLWVFDDEQCSAQKLEVMVRYLRRALYKLDNIEDLPFLTSQWRWEEPPIAPGSKRVPSGEELVKLYPPPRTLE